MLVALGCLWQLVGGREQMSQFGVRPDEHVCWDLVLGFRACLRVQHNVLQQSLCLDASTIIGVGFWIEVAYIGSVEHKSDVCDVRVADFLENRD